MESTKIIKLFSTFALQFIDFNDINLIRFYLDYVLDTRTRIQN